LAQGFIAEIDPAPQLRLHLIALPTEGYVNAIGRHTKEIVAGTITAAALDWNFGSWACHLRLLGTTSQ